MSVPRVSIVITAYNVAPYVAATIDSALAQTYPNCEVIVVDDGSTDETSAVLESYSDRIEVIAQANSGGPAGPRNVGIASASGEFIAILDGDDVLSPDAVAASVDALTLATNAGLAWGDFATIDAKGELTGARWSDEYTSFREHLEPVDNAGVHLLAPSAAFECLLRGLFVGISSVVLRRSVVEEVGQFDETLGNGDDRDMWLRVARAGHAFAYRDRVAFQYRVHGGSVSHRGHLRIPAMIKVLERQLPYIESRQLRRDVEDRIAVYRLGYAYGLRQAGDHRAAALEYTGVFKQRPSWVALKGIVLSLSRCK